MQGLSRWLFRPGGGSAPPATILIRLAVGGVFFASGLIKFLYANQGAGRFTNLGIPAPSSWRALSASWRSLLASCSQWGWPPGWRRFR